MQILEHINSREDLLAVPWEQEAQLCQEIRQWLVQNVAKTGGHLASNLGIVELQVAIEKEFDTRRDRLVFDVGHQSYVHKILTGRRDAMTGLRTLDGISGFPKPDESGTDAFVAGHASNAVSVALGMARARTLQGADYNVIALLGDGAMTGGLFYEGMNDAGASKEPLIVILNDNEMSIAKNVGGIAGHLKLIRCRPGYFKLKRNYRRLTKALPGGQHLYNVTHRLKDRLKRRLVGVTIFEEMGFQYMGPVDGHDITRLIYMLRRAKEMQGPVLLHVLTKKGKGYAPAEENPALFHGIGQFDPVTGVPSADGGGPVFSDVFGKTLCSLAQTEPRLCAITAAMCYGTGLEGFARQFPKRYFDVGIAEGHAVCLAGGLAKQGMIPVVAVYSTFLQRAYDMLLQDVAMQRLHVVFAVDRAGLVGPDGETHQGIFDAAYLRTVPGMTVLCPANGRELERMLSQAICQMDGPVAVRYPRGGDGAYTGVCLDPVLRPGRDVTIIAYGTMINEALQAAQLLEARGIRAAVLKLNAIAPLDLEQVLDSARETGLVIVAEEAIDAGCVGQAIAAALAAENFPCRVLRVNLGDRFIQHGTVPALRLRCGIDAAGIATKVEEALHGEE